MGRGIRVTLAGLAIASVGMFGNDIGRLISHTPHKTPPIHKPPPIDVPPVDVPPVDVPPVDISPVEPPPVVKNWTNHLSKEDAEEVTKVACTLKDLEEFAFAGSNLERVSIAIEYLSGKDKVEVAVGLAEKMLEGEDIDAVDEYCDLFG